MLPDSQFDKEASQFKGVIVGVIVAEGQPAPAPDVSDCNILQASRRTNTTQEDVSGSQKMTWLLEEISRCRNRQGQTDRELAHHRQLLRALVRAKILSYPTIC